MVLDSRLATKSERRNHGTDRKATQREKQGCRVNEQHGVMFIVADEDVLVVLTVLRMA